MARGILSRSVDLMLDFGSWRGALVVVQQVGGYCSRKLLELTDVVNREVAKQDSAVLQQPGIDKVQIILSPKQEVQVFDIGFDDQGKRVKWIKIAHLDQFFMRQLDRLAAY